MSILKRGLKGAPVKRLQEKLGIGADGDFGPGTEKAVRAFQEANGLAVDGIAGPDTFTAMGLHELVLLRVGSRGTAVKQMQEDLGIGADGRFGPGPVRHGRRTGVRDGPARCVPQPIQPDHETEVRHGSRRAGQTESVRQPRPRRAHVGERH